MVTSYNHSWFIRYFPFTSDQKSACCTLKSQSPGAQVIASIYHCITQLLWFGDFPCHGYRPPLGQQCLQWRRSHACCGLAWEIPSLMKPVFHGTDRHVTSISTNTVVPLNWAWKGTECSVSFLEDSGSFGTLLLSDDVQAVGISGCLDPFQDLRGSSLWDSDYRSYLQCSPSFTRRVGQQRVSAYWVHSHLSSFGAHDDVIK